MRGSKQAMGVTMNEWTPDGWREVETTPQQAPQQPQQAPSGIYAAMPGIPTAQTFTASQLADFAFWLEHQQEIEAAIRAGTIDRTK